MMRELIDECRRLLGPAPRRFPLLHRAYLNPKPPLWLRKRPGDALWQSVRNESALLTRGSIVWGRLIQANRLLFKPGNTDCPGETLYSPNGFFDDRMEELEEISHKLFALKGTTPSDPELADFAHAITNEKIRTLTRKMPDSVTGGRAVYHSSLLFHRQHLPDGYLQAGFFPLLIDSSPDTGVMVLPSRYWAPRLIYIWKMARSS